MIKSTEMTAEKRLTSKFETNTQFDEAKKSQDNSRLLPAKIPRIGSLGNSIKKIVADCMTDSSIMGLPNISKENSLEG